MVSRTFYLVYGKKKVETVGESSRPKVKFSARPKLDQSSSARKGFQIGTAFLIQCATEKKENKCDYHGVFVAGGGNRWDWEKTDSPPAGLGMRSST